MNIVFTPGVDFENLRSRATFNLVASRVAQAATLKTEKLGGAVVDLEAARAAARPNSSGSTSQGSASSNTNGTNTSPSNPRLTINRTGNGNSTVTANGSAVTSGSELEAGTVVSLSVTPAEGATPTATLNGSSVALTENEGVYSGSFQMPSANATLAINSGSATGGDSGNMD